MYIAITGNIGAGKTTLAHRLAGHYGWQLLPEAVDGNPYLADFYADMPRWAFNLQVYFLTNRFNQLHQVAETAARQSVIQDRTIYEDAAIFARNLYETGQLSQRDYDTYLDLFNSMVRWMRPPDLLIYLRADLPRLRRQIERRGRSFEQRIADAYLAQLNVLYERFISEYDLGPKLILDVSHRDYRHDTADWHWLLEQIETHV